MEDSIITKEYNVFEHDSFVSVSEEEKEFALLKSKFNYSFKESSINVSLNEMNFCVEDSGKFLEDLFVKRDVILNEKWDVSENVQGKVISINESEVSVDCLIDIESKIFQYRAFPLNMFKHIIGLAPNKAVLIKTRMKAGSIRVDVFSGDGIVNLEFFKQKENWNSLAGKGLDDRLTEW